MQIARTMHALAILAWSDHYNYMYVPLSIKALGGVSSLGTAKIACMIARGRRACYPKEISPQS